MSIKKLLPLIFLVIVPFVGFGFVKPLVDSVMVKWEEREVKMTELDAMRRTRENFDRLVNERNELFGSERGESLLEYLPTALEQERLLDMTNYVALQSGVVLQNAVFDKRKGSTTAVREVANVKKGTVLPPPTPQPDSFSVTVDFIGSYESARDFLIRLTDSGRYGIIRKFSIEREPKRSDETGTVVVSELLSGAMTFEIFYLPERTYPTAYLLPIFSSGSFDSRTLDALIEKSGGRIPPIPSGNGAGRANPFVS